MTPTLLEIEHNPWIKCVLSLWLKQAKCGSMGVKHIMQICYWRKWLLSRFSYICLCAYKNNKKRVVPNPRRVADDAIVDAHVWCSPLTNVWCRSVSRVNLTHCYLLLFIFTLFTIVFRIVNDRCIKLLWKYRQHTSWGCPKIVKYTIHIHVQRNCTVYDIIIRIVKIFYQKWCIHYNNTFLWRHTIVRTVDYFSSLFFCFCINELTYFGTFGYRTTAGFFYFQQYFSYIMATSFSGGRSWSIRREPLTMGK